MELLEPNDPKVELLNRSAKYRQGLEEELKEISDRTERIITDALIIGGTLAVAYFVVRQFTASKRRKKRSQRLAIIKSQADGSEVNEEQESTGPGVMAQIGSAIATQAAVFLLDLAKQKLSEYIEEKLAEKADHHERS
ncbi:MAG: hypothetical protein OEV74_01690 [Cyclobacteriaceae bacterium]|jgi:hypothetical protein|nr:hypothetical protein [Cyclobacteriaceae bacterium]MDH4294962.1 hypothetical protein [Cyclobacteriaceae bacterium]MDH5250045.1 hypothetical protein [Cyclobacteriaceae bacterium]